MQDFFSYLTPSDEDKSWGAYLTVAGKARILPGASYPSKEHPSGYYLKWEQGRVLNEFQLNYITEGQGVLENNHGKFPIKAGTIIIIRPGETHRYRPSAKTGWVEHYLGFNGRIIQELMTKSVFSTSPSFIQCAVRKELLDTYYRIYELVRQEEPGFQQISSGLLIKLMGQLTAIKKQQHFSGKHIHTVIRQARFMLRERIEEKTDLHQLAEELNIAYPYFRKMFKKFTGISPNQYQLEIKIVRARELLLTTDKSIKEISFELGFSSIYYFSRLFKKKTGLTPTEVRQGGSF